MYILPPPSLAARRTEADIHFRAQYPTINFGRFPFNIRPRDILRFSKSGSNAFTSATGTKLFGVRIPAGYVAVVNRIWAVPTNLVTYTLKVDSTADPVHYEIGHFKAAGGYVPPGETETLILQNGTDGYSGCVDTWISEGSPGSMNPTDTLLYIDARSTINRNTLIYFDLSDIPAGNEILSATLRLTRYSGWGVFPENVDVAALKRDTDNFAFTSWQYYRLFPDVLEWQVWGGLGTDDKYAAQGTFTTDGFDTYKDIDVTDLVADWHSGTKDNLGMNLYPRADGQMYWRPYSSDWSTVAQRPKLTIEHRTPGGGGNIVHLKDREYGHTAPAAFGGDTCIRGGHIFDPALIVGGRIMEVWAVNFSLTQSDSAAGILGFFARLPRFEVVGG